MVWGLKQSLGRQLGEAVDTRRCCNAAQNDGRRKKPDSLGAPPRAKCTVLAGSTTSPDLSNLAPCHTFILRSQKDST